MPTLADDVTLSELHGRHAWRPEELRQHYQVLIHERACARSIIQSQNDKIQALGRQLTEAKQCALNAQKEANASVTLLEDRLRKAELAIANSNAAESVALEEAKQRAIATEENLAVAQQARCSAEQAQRRSTEELRQMKRCLELQTQERSMALALAKAQDESHQRELERLANQNEVAIERASEKYAAANAQLQLQLIESNTRADLEHDRHMQLHGQVEALHAQLACTTEHMDAYKERVHTKLQAAQSAMEIDLASAKRSMELMDEQRSVAVEQEKKTRARLDSTRADNAKLHKLIELYQQEIHTLKLNAQEQEFTAAARATAAAMTFLDADGTVDLAIDGPDLTNSMLRSSSEPVSQVAK